MRDENRANELTQEIGHLILQDPKLAHGTWNAFSLVIGFDHKTPINYGFVYDVRGKADPFTTDIPTHLIQELRECLQDQNKDWLSCLLQIKSAAWEMTWEFEYNDAERFVPTGNVTEMANFLSPHFNDDQFWQCPLSHNVLNTLRGQAPHLIEDLGDENLHCMITNALLKGMRHGLRSRSDLACFAITSFEVAPNFDSHPAIRAAFLKVRNIPGSVWNFIYAAVPEHVWEDMSADQFYDGKAWFSELPRERIEEVA